MSNRIIKFSEWSFSKNFFYKSWQSNGCFFSESGLSIRFNNKEGSSNSTPYIYSKVIPGPFVLLSLSFTDFFTTFDKLTLFIRINGCNRKLLEYEERHFKKFTPYNFIVHVSLPVDALAIYLGFKFKGKGYVNIKKVRFEQHDDFYENSPLNIYEKVCKTFEELYFDRKINFNLRVIKNILLNNPTYFFLYKAIDQALRKLPDRHSSYSSPSVQSARNFRSGSIHKTIFEFRSDKRIAYIKPSPFLGSKNSEADLYIDQYNKFLKQCIELDILFYVIDFKGFKGGNMWPLLTALSFFLVKNPVGYFNINEQFHPWRYLSSGLLSQISDQAKVCVWIDQRTASAGEALALALSSQRNCVLIGRPTAGLTTAVQSIQFDNLGTLRVAIGYFTDYKMKIIKNGVTPHFYVKNIKNYYSETKRYLKL